MKLVVDKAGRTGVEGRFRKRLTGLCSCAFAAVEVVCPVKRRCGLCRSLLDAFSLPFSTSIRSCLLWKGAPLPIQHFARKVSLTLKGGRAGHRTISSNDSGQESLTASTKNVPPVLLAKIRE